MTDMDRFSPKNPTGSAPGTETVDLDVLKAAVNNRAEKPEPPPQPAPAPVHLVGKNLRLPADLVEFVDFEYTKRHRMKKQDAYSQALEAYFRPLMQELDKA
jgi:hypothetical protein